MVCVPRIRRFGRVLGVELVARIVVARKFARDTGKIGKSLSGYGPVCV